MNKNNNKKKKKMELLRKTALLKLEQQTKGSPVESVTELHFATVPLVPVELLTSFSCLRKLCLVSMKPALKSVLQVPLMSFPVLTLLDLSDNKIGDTPLDDVRDTTLCCPSLKRLLLVNNNISAIATVNKLGRFFPNAEVIELADNPVVASFENGESSGFRNHCFTTVWPSTLRVLDGKDANGDDVEVLDSDEDEEEEDDEEEYSSDDEDSEESDESSEGNSARVEDERRPAKRPRDDE